MIKILKYLFVFVICFWCFLLKAGDVLSLRQASAFKKEGEAAFNQKDFISSILKLEQAASAYKHFGKLIDFLSCSEMLCLSYEKVGLYDKAISIKEEQMEIHSTGISNQDSNYSMHLGSLAHLYSLKGDYNKSILLANEALTLKKNVYGEDSDEYVTALNNIAYYYSCLGNYEVATSYMKNAASIIERTKGKNSKEYATFLNYMASVCFQLEMYKWALELETTCVDILSDFQDNDDFLVALQNLALYKIKVHPNQIRESIELAEKSLGLQKERGKKMTSFYGIGLCNLISYYTNDFQYKKAEKYSSEALELYKNLYGEFHPNITALLLNISAMYVNSGQIQKAVECISKTTEGYYHQTLKAFKNLTKDERTYYWLRYEPWCLHQLPYYALKLKNDKVTCCTYDAALFSKGLLLNSEKEISEIIKESKDSSLICEYNEMQRLNNTISFLSQLSNQSCAINIDSLKMLMVEKEKHLIEKSTAYGDFTRNLNIRWKDVQAKLGSKDIAVEFLSLPYYEGGNTYIALLLKKNWNSPKLVQLVFNDSIESQDFSYLSKCIWKPLLQDLRGIDNIFFAPSGKLNSFPIESFPMPNDSILISEKYNLYRLSSTRELAIKNHNIIGENAVLYGGLIYNTDIAELENDSKKYRMVMEENITRSILDEKSINGIRECVSGLVELPGTKKEVEQIGMIIRSKNLNHLTVDDYIGNKGTEVSFKSLSGKKKKIIHIATHGFYLSDDTNKLVDNLSMAAAAIGHDINDVRSVEDKSLTRCGLCFAGADNKLQGEILPDGLDDGILTAQEISTLDLRGLDMVSLSACQTAQGDIMSDGVFGLQRGFKKAGAKSILMSLWKVDDKATCLLMTEFYKNWIGKGKSKHQALELAKQEVRSRKGWEDPKYWAAFILLDGLN